MLDALEQTSPVGPFPPDMVALAQSLMERFTDLRARGQAKQSPKIYEYEPWNGLKRILYADFPKPPAPHDFLPPAGTGAITQELKDELVNALLDCEVILAFGRSRGPAYVPSSRGKGAHSAIQECVPTRDESRGHLPEFRLH